MRSMISSHLELVRSNEKPMSILLNHITNVRGAECETCSRDDISKCQCVRLNSMLHRLTRLYKLLKIETRLRMHVGTKRIALPTTFHF
jgi:hypothetical protein